MLAMVAPIWLSGCGTVAFDPSLGVLPTWQANKAQGQVIEMVTVCPPLVQYERVFLNQTANAIEELSEGSPLIRLVADYGALREAIRQC